MALTGYFLVVDIHFLANLLLLSKTTRLQGCTAIAMFFLDNRTLLVWQVSLVLAKHVVFLGKFVILRLKRAPNLGSVFKWPDLLVEANDLVK